MLAFILNRRLNAVSVRAALSVALALPLVPTGTAQAELFWSHYRSGGWDDYGPFRSHHYRSWGWDDHEPFTQKRHRTNKGYELEQKPKSLEVVKGPLQLIISIADQKISVYDDGTLIARSSVSTGVQGHPPSSAYSASLARTLAPLQYLQCSPDALHAADHLVRDRIHAGVLPGHPASHGCIRLAKDFAIRLWHLTKRGTRVIIAPNNVDPVQIASPRLFLEPKTVSSSQDTTNVLAGRDVLTIPSTPPVLVPNAQSQKNTNLLPATGVVLQKKGCPDLGLCEP